MKALLVAVLVLALSASGAFATQCRDKSGKFIKCPAAPSTAMHCRNSAGKFAKCGTPGAKPI